MLQNLFYRGFLNENEVIHVVVHRHIFLSLGTFLRDILFGILMPAALWLLFPQAVWFAGVWGWFGMLRIVYDWVDWYYDAWLVTNISIIQVEWDGFFKKNATRTEYHHVESVGYAIEGVWGTICNFGTITVEKLTGATISFTGAAFPKGKVEKMLKYQDNFITDKNLRDHRTLKGLLTDLLSQHFAQFGASESKKKE